MSHPFFTFRHGWRLGLMLVLFGVAVPLLAEEEEEEGKAKPPTKKVQVPDEDPNPMTEPPPAEGAGGAFLTKLDDLARGAATAKSPTLKAYYSALVVPFDRLTESNGKSSRVTPLPLLSGKDRFPPEFGIAPLGDDNQLGENRTVALRQVRSIEPFERIAITATDKFLKGDPGATPGTDDLSKADRYQAAERVLTAVLFFHDSAREQQRRRTKSWEQVKTEVYDKLTEVRLARVRQAADDRDWPKVKELTARLVQLYKANPRVLEQVYAARLSEAGYLVGSDKLPDLERARELLNEYDARFPNSGSELAKKVRQQLADRARKVLTEAERQFAANKTEARNLLKTVEAIDPDNTTLREMQQQFKTGYPVLVVGTRRLPERMSPAWARFDSERQAVELMFEGLLGSIPDDLTGVRYEPVLAADRPTVGPGYRDLTLVGSAEWTGPDRGLFDAADVAGTLRLFRQSPASWAADAVPWFDEPGFDPNDPGRIRMRLKMGYPDPRELLTLKMHPARWLLEKNKTIEDLEFAKRPFGTGPYRLGPSSRPMNPGDPPRDVVFLSNPGYGRRPGRMGLPIIKEIRFTDISAAPDLPAEFRGERLHILTDVPTPDLPKFTANNGLNGRVRVVTAATHRQIWTLAVNHRRPPLQSPDLRKALTHAIQRDKILTDVFRAGQPELHKAMTGPFPPGSWATPVSTGAAPVAGLTNPDIAQAKLKQFLASPFATPSLSLSFPADDPQARAACERIKSNIESVTLVDDKKLTLNLVPLAPKDLLRRVEELHDYDLAYVPFDYRDDWFPLGLGLFLDPDAARPWGRNYLGYLSRESGPTEDDERLSRLLAEARLYRDPARLRQIAHEIHRRFNDTVPFVPLWQLDRHMVISTAVKIYFDGQVEEGAARRLDPSTLFNSIARWKVE